MGKTSKNHRPKIFVDGNDPSGCIWGVLHVLNNHNWRHIKKRLPHKKPGSGSSSSKHKSQADVLEDNSNALKTDALIQHCEAENEDLMVDDDKSSQCGTPSITSRLKSLISDEISKLKGRHHRSATCPIPSPLSRSDSVNHLEPSYDDVIAIAKLHEDYLKVSSIHRSSSSPYLMDSTQSPFDDENLKECETSLTTSPLKLKQIETDKLKLPQESEENIGRKLRYSKTVSFPSTQPSSKMGEKFKLPQESEESSENIGDKKQKVEQDRCKEYCRSLSTPTIAAEYRADGILKLNQAMAAATSNSQVRKNGGHNQVVIKRFKDLKHKISHAIRERKHEKHRIAMDAILDKIPHRNGFSKDLRRDNFYHNTFRDFRDSPRSSSESDPSLPSSIKSEPRITSRASSFRESLDRYCQLYESSFNKQPKCNSVEMPRLSSEHENSTRIGVTKSMRRIFSLPNIKYTEASPDTFVVNHVDSLLDGIEDHGHPEPIMQQNGIADLNFNSVRDLDKLSISNDEQGQETKLESIPEVELDASIVDSGDNASNMKMEFESMPLDVTNSITEREQVGAISAFDSEDQETKIRNELFCKVKDEDLDLRETNLDSTKLENLCEKQEDLSMDTKFVEETKEDNSEFLDEKPLRLQVKGKDKGEFDYVKDILNISGFMKNKPLGIWHSENQPLDCSDYMFDSKCCESGNFYQMLLFDLINEVLMEIYAKSYAYYPKPLTSLSQIRPMPIGHHIFEEVWDDISWYLNFSHETDDHRSLDYVVGRDLAKSDGWMSIQNEVECVVLELEDLIFDHLLEEII